MTVTQRDWDIAQLESQLKIQRIFDEWMLGFLGTSAPLPPQANEQFIQGMPSEMGGAEEVIDNSIDNLGGEY